MESKHWKQDPDKFFKLKKENDKIVKQSLETKYGTKKE
jgi:hypothetical protein